MANDLVNFAFTSDESQPSTITTTQLTFDDVFHHIEASKTDNNNETVGKVNTPVDYINILTDEGVGSGP